MDVANLEVGAAELKELVGLDRVGVPKFEDSRGFDGADFLPSEKSNSRILLLILDLNSKIKFRAKEI